MILEREIKEQKWAVFHLISKHSLNILIIPLYFLYELLMSVKSLFLNSVHNIVGFLLKTLEKSLFRFQDKQSGRPAVPALGNRP